MYFRFKPFIRPMLWGSETWILSAYPNMESVVSEGEHAGKSLTELVSCLGAELVGLSTYQHFGSQFPLLIKFLDAQMPLSIQVHPSDEQAQRQGKGSVGKTEMWYGMKSEKDAYLMSGLKTPLTPSTYKEHVANRSIVDDLARYTPHEGDCFFLPAGRIHAVGTGCRLLEIQQTNDLTYRIYDYDRRDAQGHLRELHTDLAAESIDYTVLPDYQTHYERLINAPMDLVRCPYFETKAYRIETPDTRHRTPDTKHQTLKIDWRQEDRFLAVIVTDGQGTITIDGESVSVQEKDTLLLPATTRYIELSGFMTLVTTSIT